MPIQRFQFGSPDSQRLSDDTRTLARRVDDNPIFNGNLLKDEIVLAAGTEVAHKLGRAWQGFLVVKKTGAAIIYNEPSSDESLFIGLRSSSGTQTITLWVF